MTWTNAKTDYYNMPSYVRELGLTSDQYQSALKTGAGMKTNLDFNRGLDGAEGTGWFGQGGYLQTGAQIGQAAAGLAGAYTGYKGLQLAEDQYKTSKAFANRDILNQGTLINTDIMNRAEIAAKVGGLEGVERDTYLANTKKNYVDTSRI